MFADRMAEFIKDKRLLEGFTPKFGVGCRRITPGDPYMVAIQEENVDVHFTAVKEATEDGVVGADGVERKVDTIVCATGFDVSYRPRFPLVGRGGLDLKVCCGLCGVAEASILTKSCRTSGRSARSHIWDLGFLISRTSSLSLDRLGQWRTDPLWDHSIPSLTTPSP